jgi:predicted RND superfamily exporter protein
MAALTTATGFLVMSVSELKGLSELAFYSSFGVMTTFLLTISLLVVFLAGSKKKSTESSREMAANPLVLRYIQHCITFNQKRPKLIAILGLAIGITGLAGVFQLKVDFNFFDDFKDHVPWKMESVLAEEVMGGLLNVTYVIDTSKAEGIKDPAIIAAIEKIQRYAEQQPLVEKTFSLADIIKDLNRSFHGDDDSYYKLPESRELLAQYLLTYEVSGGEELWELVTLDFSRTAVEMRVKITDATKINALIASINDFIAQNPIPGAEVKQTGIGLLWVKICDYIANTQMVSYSLVLLMIAIFMSLSFGSLKVGLFAMIPNIFPIIVVLGFMGWRGIHLDYMKLLLATIAIGIAVDDTIHLFTRLRKHFNESGNYRHAMAQALTDVGPALVITSIILVVSFSTFLFSNMNVLSSFGLLLAGSISTALLADIYLMPALTLLVKPFGPERAVSTTAEPEFSNESTPNQQALTEGTI